jgi:hypothetical protein
MAGRRATGAPEVQLEVYREVRYAIRQQIGEFVRS